MNYPREILPKKYYRVFSLEEIDNKESLFIIRRSLKRDQNETFDEFGFVRADALIEFDTEKSTPKPKEVLGLSVNLLGGHFKSAHIKYSTKGAASNYWGEGAQVSYKQIRTNVEELGSHSIPVYFSCSDIDGQSFPYERNVDKTYRKKMPDAFKLKDGPTKLQAETKLIHKPTLGNYWHFEIHIIDKITEEVVSKDKASGYDGSKPVKQQKYGIQVALCALETILITSGKNTIDSHGSISNFVFNKRFIELPKFIKSLLVKFRL